MAKRILCACYDVTQDDVREAFAHGHRDLESVKRYTGFGTGPCQGKSCVALVARELARLGATPAELAAFTPRPPASPLPLGALAALDPEALPIVDGVPPEREASDPPPRPSVPLPARADVVIVGGGILGLALAYELGRRGVKDVAVLERSYLNAGASGRNGGGVRAQWTTPTMIRLAKRSIARMRDFATELGVNVWLRQGGYLFLAPEREQAVRLERNLVVHHREGLRTRLLTPHEALEVAPELDPTQFVAAAYNPDDGTVFPWPFLYGYAERATAAGAKVCTFTRVVGFQREGTRLTAVVTDRGTIRCDTVVNACGAWSKEVAALAGVHTPNRPTRHEICVTEPLKPWLDPLVSVLGTGLYFSQDQRGEVVGGMGDPAEPEGIVQGATLRFLARYARAITRCAPVMRGIQVVRQWAGCYDVTPDNNPILGAAGHANFLQLHGFVGHGFMMAPAVTEAMAAWMAGGERDEIFERFTLARFDRPSLEKEDFIIG